MRRRIYGNWNDEVFTATETVRESFFGYRGDDTFVFYRGDYTGLPVNDPFADPDFSDRFFGGRGNDQLTNLEITFYDDRDYDAYSQASFDGGYGIDSVVFGVNLDNRDSTTLLLDRFDVQTRSVEIREFDIFKNIEVGRAATIGITGGDGRETVRLELDGMGTAGVSIHLNGGNDRVELTTDRDVTTALRLSTGDGNDTVILNATTTQNSSTEGAWITTGNGNDTIVLEGMHGETVYAGSGNDDIYLLSGSFAQAPDRVFTGSGQDRVFVELDGYSQLAELRNFSAAHDVIVFDVDDPTVPEVVFDADDWETGDTPNLFMNNATGQLFYGDNLLIDFGGPTSLTAANFVEDDWAF